MPTIALVDDDRNILTSVSIALEAEGYRIMTYTDGASALDGFKTSPPDLAILDIKMPRMDGMEMLRRLRQKTDMPVIFLTSKDEEIDELFGLKMGADDFIRKPFSQRLLVERVKAVLRRVAPEGRRGAEGNRAAKVLERGQLRMDPERHTCTWKDEPVTLTVTEFLILQALATPPGVVKSRNALMDAAYDDQVYVDDRTIDSHIKRLRKKFKVVDDDFDMIETLYGVGYRFKEADAVTRRPRLSGIRLHCGSMIASRPARRTRGMRHDRTTRLDRTTCSIEPTELTRRNAEPPNGRGAATPRAASRRDARCARRRVRPGNSSSRQSFSSLTRRIVFLNLAGLVALVIGILYLSQFRAGLIDARVQSLLVQGEIIAGAIAASATVETDSITIDPERLLELQAGESYGPSDEALSGIEFPINPGARRAGAAPAGLADQDARAHLRPRRRADPRQPQSLRPRRRAALRSAAADRRASRA